MAGQEEIQKLPVNVEVAALTAEDFGAKFVDQLRVPGDGILASRGGGDVGIYRELLTDWQVYSTFQQRRTAVVSREWDVEPGADDGLSVKAADHLKENLRELDFDRVCRKGLMAIFEGFSPSEMMYAPDGTFIWVQDIKVRAARRFRFDRDNALRLVKRTEPQGQVMPPNKFWLFQAGADDDDDPYGLGLGHYCYWPVWLKRNGLRHWALLIELLSRGRLLGKVPAGTKPEQTQLVKNALGLLTGGGSAVVSDNVAIEVLRAFAESHGEFQSFVAYLDSAISKIVLSQTMTTDNGSSRSQSETHADVKLEVIKTDADLQCESFNRGPARWLTAWNFPGAATPRVWRKVVRETDSKLQAERDKVIHEIGWEPTDEYIREQYGPGFQRKAKPSAQQPPPGSADFAEGDLPSTRDVVRSATADWRPLVQPIEQELDEQIRDASSLEDLRGRLNLSEDPARTDGFARLMFASNLAGRADMDLDDD